MGTLGAVYGISFVAGSLASMGSAYMASKMYPIEDEPTQVPIEEVRPSSAENPAEGGRMHGGDRKGDLESAVKKYDAIAIASAAVPKNYVLVHNRKYEFIAEAKKLGIPGADGAKNSLKDSIDARKKGERRATVDAKDKDAREKLEALLTAIKTELGVPAPAAPAAPAAPILPPLFVAPPPKKLGVDPNIQVELDNIIDSARPIKTISKQQLIDLFESTKITPASFLVNYADMIANNHSPNLPYPLVEADAIELFAKNPAMVGGGQIGGGIVDFMIFDFITGIEEVKERETRDNTPDYKQRQLEIKSERGEQSAIESRLTKEEVKLKDESDRLKEGNAQAKRDAQENADIIEKAEAEANYAQRQLDIQAARNEQSEIQARLLAQEMAANPVSRPNIQDVSNRDLYASVGEELKPYLNVDTFPHDEELTPAQREERENRIREELNKQTKQDNDKSTQELRAQYDKKIKQVDPKKKELEKLSRDVERIRAIVPQDIKGRNQLKQAIERQIKATLQLQTILGETMLLEARLSKTYPGYIGLYNLHKQEEEGLGSGRIELEREINPVEPIEPLPKDEVQPPPFIDPVKLEKIRMEDPGAYNAYLESRKRRGLPLGGQRGGAMDKKLVQIIKNGSFTRDGKSTMTWDKLQEMKNVIIIFHGPLNFNISQDELDYEVEKINRERNAKILSVISWLRTIPNRSKITKSDIETIVPSALFFKEFIDILSDLNRDEQNKKLGKIKIDKSIFNQPSNVVLPLYVISDSEIKSLASKNKIETDDIIKYFTQGGSLYTFFLFKNVLKLICDYTFGDEEFDKIVIHIGIIVKWLNGLPDTSKISNKDIITFLRTNTGMISIEVFVDTLYYLIENRVRFKKNLIRVIDFLAIDTLALPVKRVEQTKIVRWLIDSSKATLPKPTDKEIAIFKSENPDIVDLGSKTLKLPTLFVGPVKISNAELTKGSEDTTPEADENVKTFGLLQKIQNTINKRTQSKKESSEAESVYKQTLREKEAAEYVKGTEAAKYKKMIEESNKKDAKIKELNTAISNAEKAASEEKVKKDNEKKFTDKLAEAIKQKEYKSLEVLLKERNADLAKEYEQVKSNENKGGELKPPEAIKGEWGNLIGKIKGMNGDHSKLTLATIEFRKTHTDEQVKPQYKSIDGMFNALWAKFGKKKGGYHETLRNHLRSRRHTYRRL